MILSSLVILIKTYDSISFKPFYLPLIAGTVLFRPTIVLLINGQFAGLLLLLLTLIIVFWERGKWAQGAALLPLLALKPNLGVPVIVLLSVYLLRQGKVRALITAVISGFLLLVAGWIQNPNWIAEFWHAGLTKVSQIFGYAPTVWGASAVLCQRNLRCSLVYGASLTVILLMVYFYMIMKKTALLTPSSMIALSIVTMLLVTPSSWPYDQVLLIIPIVTITMLARRRGSQYLTAALTFLAIDILAWALLGIAVQTERDFLTVLVPLVVFGLLVWNLRAEKPVQRPLATGQST